MALLMDSGVVISISWQALGLCRTPREVERGGLRARRQPTLATFGRCARSMPKLVPALEQEQRQRRQTEAENPHDDEACLRRNVGESEEAVTKAVDHIEERIEMRQRLPE